MTSVGEYLPTPNELNLIEVLSSPEGHGKNITEICKLIGISRTAYYKMFKKADFVKFYKEFQLELVKSSLGEILQATIHYAKTNPKNHADRRMLLEMGAIYSQKTEIDHVITQEVKPDLTKLSPEELLQLEEMIVKSSDGK